MKLKQIFAILSTSIIVASCASVSSPEGGPKDENPPILKSSTPKDQQLNVKGNTISLTFDEEIQPNKLNSELLITPNTDNKYKVKIDKNTIRLEFEKPFLDSTTYTFNFREGITDITEKNKAQNLRLSFSTGSYIDSSKVTGTVVDLLSQKSQKDVVVALYPANDTLTIRKHRPYYQTNTDATGKFEFANIKEGEYNIYALAEKNNNSIYDNEEEKIGYLGKPITITASTEPVILELIRVDTKKPILNKREYYTDRFVANYNESISSFKAAPVNEPKSKLNSKIVVNGKAAELFKTDKYSGGKTILTAVDSAGNISVDTLDIKFEGKRSQRIKGAQIKVMNNGENQNITTGGQVILELETPVTITGKEPIKVLADSIVISSIKYPTDISLDSTKTELRFKMPQINAANRKIAFQLDSTAFKTTEGPALKFNLIPVSMTEKSGVGSVKGDVDTKYKSYTIQLITQENKVVREQKNGKGFEFKNVNPGTYKLRVLVDENNNGKWDTGDPDLKRKPEKIYLHPRSLDVRANWEIEGEKLQF